MIPQFPKIFAIGKDYIVDIFKEEVEISEKLDGSSFAFGKLNGATYMRSHGQELYPENVDKMFKIAVDYVQKIQDRIPDNTIFYCEYLCKPHHNCLTYSRVPKNNLILFGVSNWSDKFYYSDGYLKEYSDLLDIESVPILYKGMINSFEEFKELLNRDSILGGTKIEGFVIKNYHRQFLLGGQPMPLMAGKYVSDKFKEVNNKNFKEGSDRNKWDLYCESFRTEARWLKSIQHLNEIGQIEYDPRDIGKLLKDISVDIISEEKEEIMKFMWKYFSEQLIRRSTAGFPEWYKEWLAKRSFEIKKQEVALSRGGDVE